MKNQRVPLIGGRSIVFFIACIAMVLSSLTGCENVPKAKYQALHSSFLSYVEKDKDKRDSVETFINNELKAAEAKKDKTKDDKKRVSRLKLQKSSMKSWAGRQDRASKYLDDNKVD